MSILKVDLAFDYAFLGTLEKGPLKLPIGDSSGALLPYDMLLAALASCYYATFFEVVSKKRIAYQQVEISVTGEKRTTIPSTLAWATLSLKVHQASSEKGVLKAAELAAKYCSIYQTLSQVAEMKWDVEFC
jgi:putative redox protein